MSESRRKQAKEGAEIRKKGSIGVFDLDDSLFLNTRFSRIVQGVAQMLVRLSLHFQRPNVKLIKETNGYRHVIILSSRSRDELWKATIQQLKRNRVRYEEVLLFPSNEYKFQWKIGMLKRIQPSDWYDDQKEEIFGNTNSEHE